MTSRGGGGSLGHLLAPVRAAERTQTPELAASQGAGSQRHWFPLEAEDAAVSGHDLGSRDQRHKGPRALGGLSQSGGVL